MNPSSPSTAYASDQGRHGSGPAWLRLGLATVVVAGALGLGTNLVRAWPGRGPVEMPADQDRAEAKAQAKRKKVVVPFEMLPTNHMMVRARINGEGPYRLIFDLGAPITLLSNRASEAAGVVKADAPRSFLLGMRGEAEIDKLQAGDLTVTKLPVIVFDHPVLKALGDLVGRRIDGIVGFTLFARYRTTIDYQAHQMTFEPVDYQIRDLLKELPDRMLGPKVARHRVLAAAGLWGIQLGEPTGGLDAPGVPVTAVEEGSPAAQGGLRPGDVITTLDGRWTASIADVFAAAADVEPGRAAAVVILRDGQEMTRTVTPADGA
ncbi:MAG TPA: PDZ domain-containing protein [Isosphaeraceae bacterium]|nr:PDZ domain-containing protein [Isosphaeraceae bacterium]